MYRFSNRSESFNCKGLYVKIRGFYHTMTVAAIAAAVIVAPTAANAVEEAVPTTTEETTVSEVTISTNPDEGASDETNNDDSVESQSDDAVLPEGDESVADGSELDMPEDSARTPLTDVVISDETGFLPVDPDELNPVKEDEQKDDVVTKDDDSTVPQPPALIEVSVPAPTKQWEPCRPPAAPEQRWVKLTPVEGVMYLLNGEPVDAPDGLIPVMGYEATITAVTSDGYSIVGENQWFLSFDFHQCPSDIVYPNLGVDPGSDMVVTPPVMPTKSDIVLPETLEASGATTDTPDATIDGTSDSMPDELAVTGGEGTAMRTLYAIGAMLMGFGLATLVVQLRRRRALRE